MRTASRGWIKWLGVVGCGLWLGLGARADGGVLSANDGSETSRNIAINAELEKLRGTWQLVSAETDGKKTPDEQIKQIRIIIEGDHHTVMFGDKAVVHKVRFTLDPTTELKSIEDHLENEPYKGKTIRAIYRVEGDRLTSCVGSIDGPRPTDFVAKPGSGWTLRRFRRVAPATVAEAGGAEYRAFEGTWRFTSLRIEGNDLPADAFKDSRLLCMGRDFTYIDVKGPSHGTFSLGQNQSPKTIETTFTDGPLKGQTMIGIYELDGDTYRVCMNLSGKDRPKELDSKAGSRNVYEVLRREKPCCALSSVNREGPPVQGASADGLTAPLDQAACAVHNNESGRTSCRLGPWLAPQNEAGSCPYSVGQNGAVGDPWGSAS